MKYDLEDRTAKFGERVIKFAQRIPKGPVTNSIVNQLIRAATSIGANYMEANEASSRKDFANKIRISGKESRETKHWLRMMVAAYPSGTVECGTLWQEAHELTLIFAKISKSSH